MGLSDVNAHLNDSSEFGDESSEQPGDESDEAGEDNGEAGDESEEPGDDGNEEGEDDSSEQIQETTVNDNAQSGMCFFDSLNNSTYFPIFCSATLRLTNIFYLNFLSLSLT